jgi:hypothetical protein
MGETFEQRSTERTHLPVASPPRNHGHTTAAWVLVVVVLIGAVVSAVAVMVAQPVLFWVGLGIVLVGVILGRVLKMLGFGQPADPSRPGSAASRRT